jgi:MraZ protein
VVDSGGKTPRTTEKSKELFQGQYPVTVDDKGRILFPTRLRQGLPDSTVVVTLGINDCLWLFTPGVWQVFSEKIIKAGKGSISQSLLIQRNLISPAMEIPFDRTGRLSLPKSLREQAGLLKEGVIHRGYCGATELLELWDEERYDAFRAQSAADFLSVMNNLEL